MGLFDTIKKAVTDIINPSSANTNIEKAPPPILAEMKSAVLPIDTSLECHIEELHIGDSVSFVPISDKHDDKGVKIFVKDKFICRLDYGSIKVSIHDIIALQETAPGIVEGIVTKVNRKTFKADLVFRSDPAVVVIKRGKYYHYWGICDKIIDKNIVGKVRLSAAKEKGLMPCSCCHNDPPRFYYQHNNESIKWVNIKDNDWLFDETTL